jgi:hypothetical protein
MSTIAHTAGPWFVSGDDHHAQPQIQAEAGGLVAIATHECVMPRTVLDANARLIAAAPDLLLALQMIVGNPDHELLPTERSDAEAAIARATAEP